MANPESTVKPGDLASLCAICSQIFQGQHDSKFIELFASPEVVLINPRCCRVCLVIWSQHEHYIKKSERSGETLNLLDVQYRVVCMDSTELPEAMLSWDLQLNYTYGQRANIRLGTISADSKCP